MAKAFDTLSHGYMEEVFKFFRMGPGIRKWLRILGTNRTACIILDDCSYSRNFGLGRGAAQGDNISPNCFNFGDQILIFKIELDPQIAGVWQNFIVPPHIPALPEINAPPPPPRDQQVNANNNFFSCESARETGKNESLADDNTTIMLQSSENFTNLRRILDDFAKVSGLSCNFDKTCVLKIGPDTPNLDLAGFVECESIKLLGLNITKNFGPTDPVFEEIHEKIKGLISFWDRFRLSLPGRISVVKNLLIPQINYLGCFLNPDPNILAGIQESLDTFALAGMQVSKDRRYLPGEDGGLGLFDLKSFLHAQKCSWVKRTIEKPIDNWRFDLKSKSPNGDPSLIRRTDISPTENPILYNIIDSYCTVNDALSSKDENYKKSQIFLNPVFVRSKDDNNLLDIPFFTRQVYDANKVRIRQLTFDDCFLNGKFKTLEQFSESGLILNNLVWLRLRNAITFTKKAMEKRENIKTDSISSLGYLKSFKKGSKKFRNVLAHCPTREKDRLSLRTVNTFCVLTDTQVPNPAHLGKVLGLWNRSFLQNEMREFLFKEHNNCLGLNNRTVHFLANTNDKCSFCRIINPETTQKESFRHLFFDCPITRTALYGFIHLSRLQIQRNDPNLKNIFWYGKTNTTECTDLLLIFEIFRYCIWKCKLRKTIPRSLDITDTVSTILGTVLKIRPKIKDKMRNNNLCSLFLQALG
jgi:hypothetical protein